jgi:tetratricopeptide (TPR) repeat protein
MMRAQAILAIVLLLALSGPLSAQNAQELYQRGLTQEHANGNLRDAIQLYSQAAKTAGKDRALAAKALIRLATCEEKLGNQTEAADAYTEVVRVFPEQRAEAYLAQSRLNQMRRRLSTDSRKASFEVPQTPSNRPDRSSRATARSVITRRTERQG